MQLEKRVENVEMWHVWMCPLECRWCEIFCSNSYVIFGMAQWNIEVAGKCTLRLWGREEESFATESWGVYFGHVCLRGYGQLDAYFNFSHSHFPLKLACLKGYLAASTYIIYIYIYIVKLWNYICIKQPWKWHSFVCPVGRFLLVYWVLFFRYPVRYIQSQAWSPHESPGYFRCYLPIFVVWILSIYRFFAFAYMYTHIYIHIVTEIPSEFGFIHVMYISPSFLLSENTHHIPAFACLGDVR